MKQYSKRKCFDVSDICKISYTNKKIFAFDNLMLYRNFIFDKRGLA